MNKRKFEICQAAKDVFLRKGFKNTTMEDVIEEVGMSKGGVYYYYKSTLSILLDLCFIGQTVREDLSVDFINTHANMSKEDVAVELVLMKMFGENEYMKLYSMLLEIGAYDQDVRRECEKMEQKQKEDFIPWACSLGMEELIPFANEEFLTLMKSMYIAQLYLDLEDVYIHRSDLFRDIIKNYMQKHKEDK